MTRVLGAWMENEQPVEDRTTNGRARALWQTVFREDRFFLVLSVFIGIFSGLAVVCFRFAIGWCRLYLLGSGVALIDVAAAAGANAGGTGDRGAGDSFVPADAGQRGESDQGSAVHLQRATFRSGRRSGNSLRRRWRLGRDIRWGRKIRRCRLARVWPRCWGER